MQLIGKLLGDPNKRDLKAIQPLVDKINALEPAMKKLSDAELAAKTAEFRSQLALYLKGGMVLEDELVKLFREVLTKVEPQSSSCTDVDLHTAVTEYRQTLERQRNLEHDLKENLQATLSECFEQAYQKLSPKLNRLRTTAAMKLVSQRQETPDAAQDPKKATISLLEEIGPTIKKVAEEIQNEAFDAAWKRFEPTPSSLRNNEEGADNRLEQLLSTILRDLQPELVALKA